jgi:putative ABC transport system permease protein
VVGLTLALLRSHWNQVLTVFTLALLAVAGAVAAPVYTGMAGRAITAADIAAAPSSQRAITASDEVRVKPASADPVDVALAEESRRRDFEHVGPTTLDTPGFATVFAVSTPSFVLPEAAAAGPLGDKNGDLEFRENFCEQVIIVAGRCVAAPGEVIVSAGRATAGLTANTTAHIVAATFVPDLPGLPGAWVPAGDPCRLAVVGVYRPLNPTDPYWGRSADALAQVGAEPVLTDRTTVATCDHAEEAQEVVAYPLPGTLGVDHIDSVRAAVLSTVDRARGRISARTDLDSLLRTMEKDRQAVALVPTTAAVPLLALCWFVLFLAIAYTAQVRRQELGIVKLRGVSNRDQWTIAATESLTPVLAGSAAGYLVGHLAVWAYGQVAFGPTVTVALTAGPWPYAAVAVAGAVLAAAVALRRDLAATATDLLRRVPARAVRLGDLAVATLLAVGAIAAVVSLRGEPSSDAPPAGLALLAPALVLLALALFAGAGLDPIAAWAGARAVHSGRIGFALAALHIGRRHAASRLLAVLVVAIGLLTFAASAAEVGASVREHRVGAAIGASRVLGVVEVRSDLLLTAVRSVDPDGAYAMAVVRVEPAPTGQPVLAVDATRLARVAVWPSGNALDAADAAAALRPSTPPPLLVRGSSIAVTATVSDLVVRTASSSLDLQATVTPTDGSPALTYDLGALRSGRQTYRADVSCAGGCRLSGLAVAPDGPVSGSFRLTVTGVEQNGSGLASAAELGEWRVRNPGVLQTSRTGAGLELSASSGLFQADGLRLVPPDAPVPLPVLAGARLATSTLDFASGDRVTASAVGEPMALPRLGLVGALADLEYLSRLGDPAVRSRSGEIWLGPDAPADVADRFRAAGLTLSGERRLADELAAAQRRPSAAGVRFLLVVSVLGLLLGAAGLVVAAGVERPSRADELRSLRTQGLSRRQVRLAAALGYAGVVAVAAGLGWLCATVVWFLTGDRLPLVDAPGPDVVIPALPGPGALAAGAAGAAALFVLALILSAVLTRAVARSLIPDRNPQ